MQKKESVLQVIKETVRKHGVLSAALFGIVCGAVVFTLLPPLVLAQLIDLLTNKHTLWMEGILLYFGLLALTGLLESARESLLTVFGQKITHILCPSPDHNDTNFGNCKISTNRYDGRAGSRCHC